MLLKITTVNRVLTHINICECVCVCIDTHVYMYIYIYIVNVLRKIFKFDNTTQIVAYSLGLKNQVVS